MARFKPRFAALWTGALLASCRAYDHGAYERLIEPHPGDARALDVPVEAALDVAGDGPPATDAPGDGASGPGTLVYVFDSMRIDPTSALDAPHTGFDLDGVCSNGAGAFDCSHEDYYSAIDPDQNSLASCGASCHHGCVDNQLPVIADALLSQGSGDLRAELAGYVATNREVILLRLTGVDSLVDDDHVMASVYVGVPTFGTDCAHVEPGRTYRVARTSLMPGATSLDTGSYSIDASIVAGRLRVVPPVTTSLPLTLPLTTGNALTLPLEFVHLRATLTPGAPTDGNVGGRITGLALLEAFCAVVGIANCGPVPPFIASWVDVQRAGVCVTSGAVPAYGDVGIGLGFTMVPAQIDPAMPIADDRPADACLGPNDGGPGLPDGSVVVGTDSGAFDAGASDAGASDAAHDAGASDVARDAG